MAYLRTALLVSGPPCRQDIGKNGGWIAGPPATDRGRLAGPFWYGLERRGGIAMRHDRQGSVNLDRPVCGHVR